MNNKIKSILDAFISGKLRSVSMGSFVLKTVKNALVLEYFEIGRENPSRDFLGIRTNSGPIGNSNTISLLRKLLEDTEKRDTSILYQSYLGEKIPMIPFEVFSRSGLRIGSFNSIDSGREETVFVRETIRKNMDAKTENEAKSLFLRDCIKESDKYSLEDLKIEKLYYSKKTFSVSLEVLRPRHFTGSRLFTLEKTEGNESKTCFFLMDIDRNEIEHGIFNPFLVELNSPVKTISESYQSLKPLEVIDAEKNKLEVLRQGEWFLIKTDLVPIKYDSEGYIRTGQNRPNIAEKYAEQNEMKLVSGRLSHSGREHKDLFLESWYQVVPNTSVQSWQLSGDID